MMNVDQELKWKREYEEFRNTLPGYARSGFSRFQGELVYLSARKEAQQELETTKKQLEEAIQALRDFKDFGTRHDTNPTGQFMDCGCFQSFSKDSWQGYIMSQDESVRERARDFLAKLNKPLTET